MRLSLRRELSIGERPPRFYRAAYTDMGRGITVWYPLGLHLLGPRAARERDYWRDLYTLALEDSYAANRKLEALSLRLAKAEVELRRLGWEPAP